MLSGFAIRHHGQRRVPLLVCYKTEVKLDKEHWLEHVPKLVITRPQQ